MERILTVLINITSTALLAYLIWFGVSGGLRRLIERSNERSRLYSIPRSMTRKMIKSGGALDIAMGFMEMSCKLCRYLRGDYDTADFFELEFLLSDYVDSLPLWNALIKALMKERRHLRYLRKYPHYLMISEIDFSCAAGLVRRLSKERRILYNSTRCL